MIYIIATVLFIALWFFIGFLIMIEADLPNPTNIKQYFLLHALAGPLLGLIFLFVFMKNNFWCLMTKICTKISTYYGDLK